jgi:beta-galactosidase
VTVVTRVGAAPVDAAVDVTWRWTAAPDGLRLALDVVPNDRWPADWSAHWARVGVSFALPGSMDRVDWFGLGPGPAYPDNGQAAHPGWFSASVEELQERTVRPQESGSRGEVRVARIGDAVGAALGITAEPAIGLAVRPWSTETLAATTHDHLLVGDGRTHVILDLARSGVGTAACGPGPLRPYRLTARHVQGSLQLNVTTATPTTEEHR